VAYDAVDAPAFLAQMRAELQVAEEQWKAIRFHTQREHAGLTHARM
jgi:peptide chain release factor 3